MPGRHTGVNTRKSYVKVEGTTEIIMHIDFFLEGYFGLEIRPPRLFRWGTQSFQKLTKEKVLM